MITHKTIEKARGDFEVILTYEEDGDRAQNYMAVVSWTDSRHYEHIVFVKTGCFEKGQAESCLNPILDEAEEAFQSKKRHIGVTP